MSSHCCLHDGHDKSVSFSQCLACEPMRIAPCISRNLSLTRLGLLSGWVVSVGQSASPWKWVVSPSSHGWESITDIYRAWMLHVLPDVTFEKCA